MPKTEAHRLAGQKESDISLLALTKEVDQVRCLQVWSVSPQALGTVEASTQTGSICSRRFRVPAASMHNESLEQRSFLQMTRSSIQSRG